ncbi:MAG: hypothetical protein LBP59_07185 [Planctomycetaceae bacterium]|nr:hypothetical protein [Planctomycetaceae bacterium]
MLSLTGQIGQIGRIPDVSPVFQDRRHFACMRLYSTANERRELLKTHFFVKR